MTTDSDGFLQSISEASQIARGEIKPALSYTSRGPILWEVKENGTTRWSLTGDGASALQAMDTGAYQSVSELLRGIRAALRQSQTGMAHLLGVSESTYEKWEQGSREPRGPGRTLLGALMASPDAVVRGRIIMDGLRRRGA